MKDNTQKKISLPSGEYLVVSVPKGVLKAERCLPTYLMLGNKYIWRIELTLESKYHYVEIVGQEKEPEIIGLASQITEEQAELIVEHDELWGYKNYEDIPVFEYAKESFHSWLKANECFLDNPYGDDPSKHQYSLYSIDDYFEDYDKWQQAQQNVSEEFLILKIMK